MRPFSGDRLDCCCRDTTVLCFEGGPGGEERDKTRHGTFETHRDTDKYARRPFDQPIFNDYEDIRGLRAAVDAIPAEALADSERVRDRGDPVGCEGRHHTAQLQEVPGGVPGRAPAHLQDEQHHELHQAAEPLRLSQGHVPRPRPGLQLLQPARARVPARQLPRRPDGPAVQRVPEGRREGPVLAARGYEKRGGEPAIGDESRISFKTVSGILIECASYDTENIIFSLVV